MPVSRREMIRRTQPHCKRLRKKTIKPRENSWSVEQQLLYIQFLKQNWDIMSTASSRKTNKIFKLMAGALRTRTPVQAKSHHQKLMQKYKNITAIICKVSRAIREPPCDSKAESKQKQMKVNELAAQEQGERLQPRGSEQNGTEDKGHEEDEMRFLASYCSFFDEFSENYGKIEEGFTAHMRGDSVPQVMWGL